LLTPEAFALAPAAPTRAPSPREPVAALAARPPARADSLFDALIAPLATEAQRRRAEMARGDPEFLKRIDGALNEGRVNFLLFGYGETHEPPFTENALIGSHTIISYDRRTRRADIISFTHDIRAPEVEREVSKRGGKPTAMRIDSAYTVGGFRLQRKMIEDATGLAIDYQITFRDAAMQRLIDNVFDGVQVTAPMAFDVHPFYLDGVKYPGGHFPQGPQKLNGRQAIQFIKTVPVAEGTYDRLLEHNSRKSLVFDALLRALDEKYADRAFWLKGATFVANEMLGGAVVCDFDPLALIVNNIGGMMADAPKFLASAKSSAPRLPKIERSLYIVDPAHGDGGVQWVNANAAVNPITQKDIDAGVYPTLAMEVPLNANPYGDLVTGYWTSVRALVKESLLGLRSIPLNAPPREEGE
ncbi:MAG: LCP family protein, partial [Chloroflexota bacterium]